LEIKITARRWKTYELRSSHLKGVLCMSGIKDLFIPESLPCFGYLTESSIKDDHTSFWIPLMVFLIYYFSINFLSRNILFKGKIFKLIY
jgi:hypothetical protein